MDDVFRMILVAAMIDFFFRLTLTCARWNGSCYLLLRPRPNENINPTRRQQQQQGPPNKQIVFRKPSQHSTLSCFESGLYKILFRSGLVILIHLHHDQNLARLFSNLGCLAFKRTSLSCRTTTSFACKAKTRLFFPWTYDCALFSRLDRRGRVCGR